MSFVAKSFVHRHAASQMDGFVLPAALFALIAATLLTLALVKNNVISLQIGGISVLTQEAQSSAELLQSTFLVRNPLNNDPGGRYERAYTPCSTTGDTPGSNTSIFDCRQITDSRLPSHTVAQVPAVQRLGCASAPRSSAPTMNNGQLVFNYNQVSNSVVNEVYGSRAEVAMGLGKLVVRCP